MRKLQMIHAAANINFLRTPPQNRLEALKGNRQGQHSIRINEIVHGKRTITAETALRLAAFFGTDAQSWVTLQSHYDMEVARTNLTKVLAAIPVYQVAA